MSMRTSTRTLNTRLEHHNERHSWMPSQQSFDRRMCKASFSLRTSTRTLLCTCKILPRISIQGIQIEMHSQKGRQVS